MLSTAAAAAEAAAGKRKFVLFDQSGDRGTMLVRLDDSSLAAASYDVSDVVGNRGFTGRAAELIDTVFSDGSGRELKLLSELQSAVAAAAAGVPVATRVPRREADQSMRVDKSDMTESEELDALMEEDDGEEEDEGEDSDGSSSSSNREGSRSKRGCGGSNKRRIRSRVKLLRSIIPGCDKLSRSSSVVLEEAIRYIRSLQATTRTVEAPFVMPS